MPSFELPSMPSWSFGSSGGAGLVSVAVESDPPGAEARASTGGAACRTPCRLNVAADGPFTVTVALNGYVPQSVPVRLMQPQDPRLGSEETGEAGITSRVDPNPIYVELERAPTPAPAVKKKQPPRRPAPTAANRVPTTAAGPSAAPPAPAPQPAASSSPPWPMPR